MTQESSLSEIQTAIYNILTQDTELMLKIVDVYENTPDNEEYPYVVIGDFTYEDFGTTSSNGEEVTVTINVYSEDTGKKKIQDINSDIKRLLEKQEDAFNFHFNYWWCVGVWFNPSSISSYRNSIGTLIQHSTLTFLIRVQYVGEREEE